MVQRCFYFLAKKLVIPFSLLLIFMVGYMATHLPLGVPDTTSIKLPNAFFYLEKGNLLPATELSDDGRMFSTPIDGTILWSYLIRWKQSTALILISNFFFWLLGLGVTYRVSRILGASRWRASRLRLFMVFGLPPFSGLERQ